jgi:hypothetical protein
LLVHISKRHRVHKPTLCASSPQFAKLATGLAAKCLNLKTSLLPSGPSLAFKHFSLCRTYGSLLPGCH